MRQGKTASNTKLEIEQGLLKHMQLDAEQGQSNNVEASLNLESREQIRQRLILKNKNKLLA